MQPVGPLARKTLLYGSLILFLAAFAFVYVASFNLGWKAVLLVNGGTLALFACGLYIRDLRAFALFMLIFLFPMEFGYHLIYTRPPEGTEISRVWPFAIGIRMDSSDVVLLLLYFEWGLRLASHTIGTSRPHWGRPLGTVFLMWIGYVLAAGMLKAQQPHLTIFEVSVLVKCFFFFLYLASNLSSLRDFRIVYYALLANNVFHSFFMAFQVTTGLNYNIHGEYQVHYLEREGFRPASFTGSWDSASSMIDITLPIVLTHFLMEKDILKRIGLLTCIGILLGGLLLTRVRASLAAVILITLTVLMVSVRRKWINWRRMTAVILSGIVLLLATTPLMVQRFRTGYYGQDRMPLIYTALNMFKHNPILGVGANNYSFRIPEYIPPELTGSWIYIVHNEFLLRLAETGIIGFLLFYTLVGWTMVALWRLTKSPEPWIFILSCGLFAAFIGSIPHRMLTAYHFDSMFYMFSLSVALTCAMQRFEQRRKARQESPL